MLPVNTLTRFRQLSTANRRIVLQTVTILPAIQILLRVIGFKRTFAMLRRIPFRKDVTTASEWNPRAWHIMRMMWTAVRRGPVHGNCLSQSLTLWWLLRLARIESDLRIGVRKDEGKFLAHAWIEHAGVPLNDQGENVRQYATFEQLPIPKMVRWT